MIVESDGFIEYGTLSHLDICNTVDTEDCSWVENTVESDTFIEYKTLSHIIQKIQDTGDTEG